MSDITLLPELLAPAGSGETLDAAVGEGADAVYLGLKDFNARIRAKNFSYRQVEAIRYRLQDMQKKLYITLNTLIEEQEIRNVYSLLQFVDAIAPDGVIVQDLGMLQLIHNNFPKLKINASTQMNVSSARGVNFLSRHGVNRVILSRELDLEQIASIRQQVSSELELFIHGALCICGSGLCLFSSYLGGKSANRGSCAQPCRRLYNDGKSSGYYFSPYDLEMVDHIPALADIGVNSFKIEGRLRSAGYIATVVASYRYLLDNYREDRERAVAKAKEMLAHDFGRQKTGYHYSNPDKPLLLDPSQNSGTGISLGTITGLSATDSGRLATVVTSIALADGDAIRIHSSDDQIRKTIKLDAIKQNRKGYTFHIPPPFQNGDFVYLIQQKHQKKSYSHIIPSSLTMFRKYPGKQLPPRVESSLFSKGKKGLPTGIYVQTNNIKDLYIIQSVKPDHLVINLTDKTYQTLLKNMPNTDFMPHQVTLYLDPWLPEKEIENLSGQIDHCIDKGYTSYIANNLAHLHLLKGRDAQIICGPYLYVFNSHAAAFFNTTDISLFCMPQEMSKRSLLQLTKSIPPANWILPAFSYPRMFTIPGDLSQYYSVRQLTDRDNYSYHIITEKNKSIVVPDSPFSLTDRIPWLRTKGFKRFRVDLSDTDLNKNQYKKIMQAVYEGLPIQGATRFNWKRGFYTKRKEQ